MNRLLAGAAGLVAARTDVREVCRLNGISVERSHAAEVVVSEFIGHAHQRGRAAIAYATEIDDGDVLVTVDDSEPARVACWGPAQPRGEGVAGLLLVEAMARSWGSEEMAGGWRIWARV